MAGSKPVTCSTGDVLMTIVDFNLVKETNPQKTKKGILPKKQAGSYRVEDLFKLDDVMKMLEKHWFGVSICFTFWPILSKSLRWEDPSQEGCLAINDGS